MWRQGFSSLKRCLLRGSFLSLCLIVFGVADTRTAWGTCGDYLAGHGGYAMPGHSISGQDAASDLMLGGDVSSRQSVRGPQRRTTCSGPQCHQRQPVPTAPPRQIEVLRSHDAVLSVIARLVADAARTLPHPAILDRPVAGPVDRLFRPPRTV